MVLTGQGRDHPVDHDRAVAIRQAVQVGTDQEQEDLLQPSQVTARRTDWRFPWNRVDRSAGQR